MSIEHCSEISSSRAASRLLFEEAQSGNRDAMGELLSIYEARILTAVRVRLGPSLRKRVESWDIVQQVMIELIKSIPNSEYRSEGAFVHYVNRIVLNRIRDESDRWTTQQRTSDREHVDLDYGNSSPARVDMVPDTQRSQSSLMILNEEFQLLEQALDSLKDDEREIVASIKIEGQTCQEVAKRINSTPEAVRAKLKRAMTKLTIAFSTLNQGTDFE